MLARTSRNCPGRMKTSRERVNSINLRHECMSHSVQQKQQHQQQKRAGSLGRWFAQHQVTTQHRHGPCGEAMPAQGSGEGQQSLVAEGWQGAHATSMTPMRALSTTAEAYRRGCCPVSLFFLLHCCEDNALSDSDQRKNKYNCCSRALGPTATHAAHPSKHNTVPRVTSMDSLRVIVVEHRAHMQKQQQQLISSLASLACICFAAEQTLAVSEKNII